MAFFNWAAVAVGVVLALHHVAAAGVVYLILFYATFVGTSLEESFEFIRLISRAIGRCAKFAGIAATQPDIVDVPRRTRPGGAARVGSSSGDLRFAYRDGAPLFEGLDLRIEPGEHVGLVGPSGSGKTTLTKLHAPLRRPRRRAHRDRRPGHRRGSRSTRCVGTSRTSRRIRRCCTAPSRRTSVTAWTRASGRVDMDLVRAVGRAAYVDEFVERLPRRLRHGRGGARHEALGRPAPAGGHRAGHGQGGQGARPRRGHLGARLGVGVAGPRGPVAPHGGHDGARRGPPAGDDRPAGPHRGPRPRPRRRAGHARRAALAPDRTASTAGCGRTSRGASWPPDAERYQVAGRPGVLGAAPPPSHPGPGQSGESYAG